MKAKILGFLLTAAVLLSAGCGGTDTNSDNQSTTNSSTNETEQSSDSNQEENTEKSSVPSSNAEITLEDVMNASESPEEDFGTITSADGECEINEYYGTDEIVVIPSVIDGEKVVSIGKNVFSNDYAETVRAVRLSDSVVSMLIPFELLFVGTSMRYDLLSEVVAAAALLLAAGLCTVCMKNSVGYGDMKLFIIMGLLLSMDGIWGAIFLSLIISFFVSLYVLITKKKTRKDVIPFAPAIVIGTFLSVALSGV